MALPAQPCRVIHFGAFELDAAKGELRKAGVLLKIHPQPFRVLLLLAEHPGQIVTREEIQRSLWGDNTFVDFERGINFSINQIRVTLGDDAEKPRYVETLPRRGYRFIAPITTVPSPGTVEVASQGPASQGSRLIAVPAAEVATLQHPALPLRLTESHPTCRMERQVSGSDPPCCCASSDREWLSSCRCAEAKNSRTRTTSSSRISRTLRAILCSMIPFDKASRYSLSSLRS